MKTQILFGAVALAAAALVAAEPQDQVKSAAKKLADAGNYSWRSSSESAGGGGGGGGGRFRAGPTEGKIAKDGIAFLTMTRGDTTTEAVLKDGKGAIKLEDGWQSLAEATESGDGQANRGRFLARMLQGFKPPAAEVADLVSKVKTLKKEGEAFTGDLTPEGVKDLLTRVRRPGGNAPEVSDPKGNAKFWVKDGQLTKYEYNLQGTMNFNGNDINLNRTTTVEIKEVGTTKVTIPEDAKKKLAS